MHWAIVCEYCVLLFVFKFIFSSSNIQNFLVYPSFYCELRSSTNTRKKNLKELGVEIQTVFPRQTIRIRHILLWKFCHSDRYYHLSKCWYLLNHPVYASINNSGPIMRFWLITSENIIERKMYFGQKHFVLLFILYTKQFATWRAFIELSVSESISSIKGLPSLFEFCQNRDRSTKFFLNLRYWISFKCV